MIPDVISTNLRNWGIGLAAGVAGCLANIYLALDLGFGLHFVFGAIFLYPVLRFLGPVAAIISAGVAGAATVHLWGHPWALVIFVCEAAFVSWIWRRRKQPFIFAIVGYWALIGIPLVFLFYAGIIGMDMTATWLVAVKQAFNSVVASAIGTLLTSLVISRLPQVPEERLSALVPHRLMMVGLFPIAVFVWSDSSRYADVVDRGLASQLERSAAEIEVALDAWLMSNVMPLDHAAADFLRIKGANVANAEVLLNDISMDSVWQGFGVYTPDGQIVASRGDPAVFPQDLSSRVVERLAETSSGAHNYGEIQRASPGEYFQFCVPLFRGGKLLGIAVGGIAAETIRFERIPKSGSMRFRISLPAGDVLTRRGPPEEALISNSGMAIDIAGNAYRVVSPDYDGGNVMLNHWNAWLVRDMTVRTSVGDLRLEVGLPYRGQISAFRAKQAALLTVALGLVLAIAFIAFFAYRQIAIGRAAVDSALRAMGELKPMDVGAFSTPIPEFDETIAIARETNESLCEQAESLQELATQLRYTTESVPIITYSLERGRDEKWHVAFYSQPGQKMSWFDLSMFGSRQDWFSFVHPDDHPALVDAIERFRQVRSRRVEYRVRSRDGEWRWVLDDCAVVSEQNVRSIEVAAGAIVDIHERRMEAEKLASSARLITLGEMATSMAHEINQPLNTIRMASENALFELEDPADGKVDLEYLGGKFSTVVAQTERAAAIIDHMRIFGRRTNNLPEPFHVEDAIGGALTIAGPQVRTAGIALDFEVIGESLPEIAGHQQLLEQVIINLVLNARDAIQTKSDQQPDQSGFKGEITIRGEYQKLREAVVVQVEDNGGGVPAILKARLFDPFFTTKPSGKGTGLGLSVSYGIISEMNGTIVCLDGDEGAIFEIRIPVGSSSSKEVAPELAGETV